MFLPSWLVLLFAAGLLLLGILVVGAVVVFWVASVVRGAGAAVLDALPERLTPRRWSEFRAREQAEVQARLDAKEAERKKARMARWARINAEFERRAADWYEAHPDAEDLPEGFGDDLYR